MRRRLAVPTKSMMMLGFSSAERAWTTETSAHAARAAVRSMLGEFVAPFVVRVPSRRVIPGIRIVCRGKTFFAPVVWSNARGKAAAMPKPSCLAL
jgi:hypothetical protein